ncbi:MAG TPA: chorismate synthase [Planctomycetota bacterium]|nr:chorismate synthase [Planctomycetota bacterium]
MLRRLSVQTSGESHGRGLLATVTGVPAGFRVDREFIDAMLARRQGGYGRSARQRLEHDRADILSGEYRGRTSGAPLTLAVWNQDDSLASKPAVERPRPGHADLAGGQKYGTRDMRPVLERASARETAARVAAGGLAASVLADLGIEVFAHVLDLGGVRARPAKVGTQLGPLRARRDRSPFYCLDRAAEARMRAAVEGARRRGDTLGGGFEVQALGVPPGLGSLDEWGSRLDARLGAALLSIPAIKAVEIGAGLAISRGPGRAAHDELSAPGPEGPRRAGNRAGGIEGGMSNGQPLVVRAYMKPLSTLARPLRSWDFAAGRPGAAFYERSDVTALPAASVVGEAMVALIVLDALLERTGGDHRRDVEAALARQRRTVARLFGSGARKRRATRGRRR